MSEPTFAGSTAPTQHSPPLTRSRSRFAKLVSLWHHHSLKAHIATLFTVLIVIACGVIAWSNHVQGRKVVLGAALDLIDRIDNDAAGEMKHLFKPAEMLVTWMSRTPISEGGAFDKRVASLPALVEVLRNQPQIGAIYAGYENGEFLLVRALRDPVARAAFAAPDSAAFLYQTTERRGGVMQSRLVVLDAALDTLSDTVLPDWNFDPRTRPWFVEARKTDTVVTTAPYVFFSTRQVGVTVARRAEHGRAVVGADVTLSDVSEKLKQVRPTPSSQLAMYGIAGDRVIAFSDPARVAQATTGQMATLARIQDLSPVLAAVAANPGRFVHPSPLEIAGRKWLAKASPVTLGTDQAASFVIATPLDELLVGATTALQRTLMLALAIILVSVPITWWISRRIAANLNALTTQAAAIRRFDFSERPLPLTRINEIYGLGRAMGEMRGTIRKFVDVTTALTSERNLERLLQRVLKEAEDAAAGRGGIVYLLDDDGHALKPAAQAWQTGPADALQDVPIHDRANPIASAAEHTATAAVHMIGPTRQARLAFLDAHFGHEAVMLVTVPLLNRAGEIVGMLCIFLDGDASEPSPERMALVEAFAGTGAAAIDNQRLLTKQKALLEALIALVANAIDAKSPYTGGHCQRVPDLTKMLARAACEAKTGPLAGFNMDEEAWEALHIGAWLHDCGKVTTPEYVVDKATKLETLYDRIHEVRMRFEVLKRDAQIECLKAIAAGGDPEQLHAELAQRWHTLDEEFAFVASCNEGGEFMARDKVERLEAIASRTWQRTLDDRLGISHETAKHTARTPRAPLPATEQLLADKPEHIVERPPQELMPDGNPWGFKLDVPPHLYNRGELYNLSIARGTLTPEERYKINDHIVQTIIMLSKLPFPRHLKAVPELAGGHHEKMDGGGYPKRLLGSDMSVQARIMAIADIFEALTAADRPYKKGKTLSEAIDIMFRMKKDRHIDADLFDLFLTSGVYRAYAERYMERKYIDDVDISRYVSDGRVMEPAPAHT